MIIIFLNLIFFVVVVFSHLLQYLSMNFLH